MSSIGDRVLQILEQALPGVRQREIADRIGMTPDAFSRALSGERRFASIELARLSEVTGADLHWLIIGQPDPNPLSVAARHHFDHATRRRTVPGRDDDRQVLEDIALAYRQAYPVPDSPSDNTWPSTADAMRAALGPSFVRPFAKRLEEHLDIGVVRVAELSTAYSMTVGGRRVIAIPATNSWFRQNWDLAHELGHCVLSHCGDEVGESKADRREAAANGFAADLLLPAEVLNGIGWDSIDEEDLACHVWNLGVSIDALCRRLKVVTGSIPPTLARWSGQPTQRLLRHHLPSNPERDEITVRMDQASQRRFPLAVQDAHLERIASGAIGRATLAWMLGIDASELEVDSPDVSSVGDEELAALLGL